MRRWTIQNLLVGKAALVALSLTLLSVGTARAVDRIKANNVTNLDQAGSWTGGIVPGTTDVGVWNSTVTGANATLLGTDQSWGGLRIANPGGAVAINAGSTLTVGASGIDMSAATQDLTIGANLTLLAGAAQSWHVGAGRTLSVAGTYTRGARGMIDFDNSAGGVINLATPAASTLLGAYATINKTDFAALDASKNVGFGSVEAAASYLQNPNTGTALPNQGAATIGVLDVVNSNTNGVTAVRLSGNVTLSTGIRFNAPHATGLDWVVDINTRNLNMNNAAILVTPNVGAKNVIFNSGSGSIRMSAGTDLLIHQHNTAGDLIIAGQITQAGAGVTVTKTGAGRLIFSGDTNGYTGTTNIYEGTVQIGNGGATGAISATGAINNNAILRFNRNNAFTFANAITGPGSVAIANTGAGEVTLSGANTYTGATTFESGLLNLTALDDVGAAAAPLIFNGGGIKHGAVLDISTKTTTFNAGGAVINTNGNNVTYAGAVGGGGGGGLTKTGAGTLTLAAANTYTGVSAVNGGTLAINGSVAGGALAASGGTLGGTGSIIGNTTVNSGGILAPGNSVGTLTSTSVTLDAGSLLNFEFGAGVNDKLVSSAVNGLTINGGAFNLVQENTATTFTTPGVYTLMQFAGAIQGTGLSALSVANAEAGFNYAFGTVGNNLNLTITSTGIVANWVTNGGGSWGGAANWSTNPTVPNAVGASARFITSLGAPATVNLDGAKTVGGVTFNSANGYTIAQGSGGTLTFSNTGVNAAQLNSIAGSHTISAGVQLTSNLAADIQAGSTVTVSGAVNGAGAITKTDGGTLILGNAANNYGGGTNVSGGMVQFAALGSLGSGNVSLSGGGALRYATGNTSDISSKIVTLGAGGGVIDTNGNNVTFANAIGNSGAGGFTKAGAGKLIFSADNTYTGPTTVTGGALGISANGQLGVPSSAASVTLSGGGALSIENDAIVNLDEDGAGANARVVTLGTGGGVIDAVGPASQLNVRGLVTGAGGLTKTGAGGVLLNAANNYTGGTTVQQGMLTMGNGGALGTGAVALQGTGLLVQNTFALPGALAVSGTPTLRGGSGSGTTSAGVVTGTGTLTIEINTGVYDLVGNMTGFTGTVNLTNAGGGTLRWRGSTGSNTISFNLTGVTSAKRNNDAQIFLGGLSGDAASILTGGTGGATNSTEYVIGALNQTSEFMGIVSNGATIDAGTGLPFPTLVTKVGTGTLTLSGLNTYTGNTRVNAGSLKLTQQNVLGDLADVLLASGATLNLDNGAGTDLIDSLYLNGISQLPGIYGGIGSGAQFTTPLITGSGFLQVSTYDLPGDFNNDNVVDALDLGVWQGAFGVNALADSDQDGDSDGNDFLIWQRFLGATNPPAAPASGAVPEPGMLTLVALALPALAAARRRRRA